MALTAQQLKDIIRDRVRPKIIRAMVFADIASAVMASSGAQKAELVAAVRRNDARGIGRVIMGAVEVSATAAATTEAEAMAADGTLNLAEMDRFL